MEKYNFTLVEERALREVGGIARLWRHKGCGAQLLSISNDDENKCFGVSFYTPPADSTGVAHILEHSVLCGSARFPLKEPFAELLKGSLQTFLNAFTFPDKTCYPVASANLRDFYNLIEVYLDAVFHPLLSENTFRQEGWHIEAESADAPWSFKGVVYNEMKGVYSSPDSILAEQSQQAAFPDNLYNLDSGGNPEHIPDLTWQAFREFHSRYYQPGNARFFFWGDDPEDERLKIIDAAIGTAGPVGPLPEVALQKQWSGNRYVEKPYAASEDENRALTTVNWLLPERGDVAAALRMEMLEHILEGLPGSPLRRALMESGLGEDTAGCGLETDLRQMYYSTGLKGIAEADAGKTQDLVIATLSSLADKGIDKAAVEAAVNTVEFAYREDNSGRFPRGLSAMLQSLSTWLYGGDPIAPLAWEKPLAEIKNALATGEKVFEDIIRKHFLDNAPVRVTLLPDARLGDARLKAETQRLAEIQEEAGPDTRQQMVRETEALVAAQLKPDSPEDLAKIPALGVRDLPLKNRETPIAVTYDGQRTFIVHDLPTRGIAYTNLLLPVRRLPSRLVPMLPLFARCLTECGSGNMDYSEFGMKMAAKTGGLAAATLTGARLDSRGPFCFLSISGKAVDDKIADLFSLMREILLNPQHDPAILKQRLELMLLEAKARLEYGLQASGHAAVSLRLAAHFTGEAALAEQMTGISQLCHIRELIARLGTEPASVLSDLELIRQAVIAGQDAIFDVTAAKESADMAQAEAVKLLQALPDVPAISDGASLFAYPAMADLPDNEAFVTPGQVNYVGKAANLYDLGYTYNGSINVIMRWLRMGRLWEDVRVAGGAYGAFCTFDRVSGTMVCASYRDPNVDRTIGAYDGLAHYLRDFTPTSKQLEQAIVGAVGAIDTYLLPDARGAQALAFYLSGQNAELRQTMRDEMLATSAKDFHDFADVLEAFAQNGKTCVLGGAKTEAAAHEHGWKSEKLL